MAEEVLIKINIDKAAAQKNAAQLEKAIAKLGVQRSELTKTLKTLTNNEIALDNQRGKVVESLGKLEAAGKGNTDEAKQYRLELAKINDFLTFNQRQSEATAAELNSTRTEIKETKTELKLLNRELESGDNSLEQQRVALIRLQREYDSLGQSADGATDDLNRLEREINQLTTQIKDQEEGTQRFQRNVGNYSGSIQEALGALGSLGGAFGTVAGGAGILTGALGGASLGVKGFGKAVMGALGGPLAIAAAIGSGIVALGNYQQELEATRKQVQLLTGAQGESLNSITASIQATADINNIEFDEVLLAANAATQQLGGTLEGNLALIQQGFAAGANQGGEFLDILREYPAQFQAAGLGLEEMIAISTQNVKSGVFSDKGVDTIKEATLRLREMPQSTKDALSAIGLSSDEIQRGLESGQETMFGTIQKVSAKLDELPPQSAEVGTAIADIFGSAGEDAGLQYITTLKDISLEMDDVVQGAGKFADQQFRLTQANQELNLTFNQLLGGADGFFTEAKIGAKELLNDGLRLLIDGVINLANFFIDLYNNALIVRVGIQTAFAGIKTVFDTVFFAVERIIDAFVNTGKVIKAIFTGNFSEIPDIVSNAFSETIESAKGFGSDVAENYVDGFNNLNKKVDLIGPLGSGATDAEAQATTTGQGVGQSYAQGVKTGVSDPAIANEVKNAIETLLDIDPDAIQLEIDDLTIDTEGRIADIRNLIDQENLLYAQQRAQGIADETAHNEKLLQLTRERLGLEAALLAEGTPEKTAALTALAEVEAEIYENKQARLTQSDIERQEYLTQIKEREEEERQLELEREAAKSERNAQDLDSFVSNTAEASATIIELTRARTDQELEATEARKQAFLNGSNAYKAAVIAQKTAALAEIAINLQREISSYWATSAAAGPAAPAVAIPLTVTALARAAGATATILRFAEGGTLSEGQSGLANGPSHANGGIFATAGNRLINFEGNEFIVKGSAAMNNLGALQAINSLGDKVRFNLNDTFAAGGSLTGQLATSQVTNQIINNFQLADQLAKVVAALPAPIVTVEDINAKVSDRVNIENRANQ